MPGGAGGSRELRVGILGCANIAQKNARAIFMSKRCRLVAVASRDPSSPRTLDWVKKCRPWMAEGARVLTYADLLSADDVEAIYVPLPTALHAEWVPRCARAGKHILLEKPVAISSAEFEKMLAVCAEHGVRLMDGTMFMHHARHHALTRVLATSDQRILGSPRRVTSAFSFRGDASFFNSNIRVSASADPLGCVGDLGWYCVRLGLVAFGWARPLRAEAVCHKWTRDGVPTDVDATVHFEGDRVLTFHCSFHHTFRQWYEIETTRNRLLTCHDFVIPRSENEAGGLQLHSVRGLRDMDTRGDSHTELVPHEQCCQEAEMWDRFAVSCNEGGSAGSGGRHGDHEQAALQTQAVLDLIMQAIRRHPAPHSSL